MGLLSRLGLRKNGTTIPEIREEDFQPLVSLLNEKTLRDLRRYILSFNTLRIKVLMNIKDGEKNQSDINANHNF